MNHCKTLFSFAVLLGAVSLSGCAGFSSGALPDATINPAQTPIGNLSGSNYGGHAPLAGAHIYLVEPGNTGYGSAVKSLITSTGSNVTQNGSWTNSGHATDQFVPSGIYGIQAGADSTYTLSGDYTCDVGRPVWVIGYGGSPSFPQNNPAIPMATSTSTSSLDTAESDGTHALYTYTTAATENFYIGEGVTVSNFANASTGYNVSGAVADPSNASQTVTTGGTTYTATLSTTQFSIYTTTTLAAGTYNVFSQSGVSPAPQVVAAPVFNPAAVNVASLGICPSSGTLANSISYIYMNEVSTVAWAYAYNQFANWSVNDQSGNNEFNVGAPATTMAQQALVNSAYVAENLYDIQGSSVSTSYAGEGHIARVQTVGGTGVVPRDELDSLGNILAACVDSNNTYRLQAGTVSPQCNTLETYATDNGIYDSTTTILTTTESHVAFNIAQTALNIAHFPQGNGTGSTNSSGVQTVTSAGTAATASAFVNALYTLPTGNVPFTPNLTSDGTGQPNDFSIGINWQTSPYAVSGTQPSNPFNASTTNTGSTTNLATVGEVAIDANGNAWIVNNNYASSQTTRTDQILRLTPAGYYTTFASTPFTAVGTTAIAGIAIDTANNLYVSSTSGMQVYTVASSYTSGGIIDYSGDDNGGQLAVDNNSTVNLYSANLNQANPPGSSSGGTGSSLIKTPATITGTSVNSNTLTVNGSAAAAANTASSCANYLGYVSLDQNNNIWTANQNTAIAPYATVCQFSNTGTLQYSYTPTPGSATGIPHSIAIDSGNNAWFADQGSNTLIEVLSGATSASGTNGTATTYTASGVLNAPKGVAVDGNNTIWVTNSSNASISRFSDAGVLMSPTYYLGSGFDTVTGGGTPSAQYAVVDMSGNLWSSDIAHGEVIEWIGVAAPTVQPIAQQRAGTAGSTGHGIGQLP